MTNKIILKLYQLRQDCTINESLQIHISIYIRLVLPIVYYIFPRDDDTAV